MQRALGEQLVADEFEFTNGKNVTLTDLGVIPGCVENLHASRTILRISHTAAQRRNVKA
jgi:hypothetical protein